MKDFAVTVKKTRKPIEIQNYIDYLKYIKPQFNIQNVNIETTRGYHLHFIIKSDTDINFRDLYPSKYGWNIKAIPIYNREGWVKYCEKDLLKNLHNRRLLLQPDSDSEVHPTEQDYKDYDEVFRMTDKDLDALAKDHEQELMEQDDYVPQKKIFFITD